MSSEAMFNFDDTVSFRGERCRIWGREWGPDNRKLGKDCWFYYLRNENSILYIVAETELQAC